MRPPLPATGNAHVPAGTARIVGGSKLLGELRDLLRRKHYSIRTEQAYLDGAKRYILVHGKRHPNEMGGPQIAAFLTHLAVERRVAAATQNQALNALVFDLYPCHEQRADGCEKSIAAAERILTPEETRTPWEHTRHCGLDKKGPRAWRGNMETGWFVCATNMIDRPAADTPRSS